MNSMPKYTPAMQQYIDMKKEHNDCILLFRLWDFYEVFFEDAKISSKALDLVLTSKNKNSDNPIPMAWVPHHSVDKYIRKLVAQWYKVAIAEQMEQATPGQLVRREVVNIITPWTFVEESNTWFSYILAITQTLTKDNWNFHIAWWDFSIWEYYTKSFDNEEDLQKFIYRIEPKEIIFDIDFQWKDRLQQDVKDMTNSLISIYDKPYDVEEYILNQTNVQSLSSYGQSLDAGRKDAFALLLNYIKNTQKTNLNNISKVSFHGDKNLVLLDNITMKNLEIFASNYENEEKYSLYWVINQTKTFSGARLLRNILMNPINNLIELNQRLYNISYYKNDDLNTDRIVSILSSISDIQKIMTSLLYKKLSATNFVKLRQNLNIVFSNDFFYKELSRLWFSETDLEESKNYLKYLQKLIKNEDENYKIKDNIDFIQDGYCEEIDELRRIAYHSDELLMNYQQELVHYFGIQNIKLKYIKNQGYFLEMNKKDSEIIESKLNDVDTNKYKFLLMRRQTLKGVQRYASEYLEEIQLKIFEARDSLIEKETEYLQEGKQKLETVMMSISNLSDYIAWLDVYSSMAVFSKLHKLSKPELGNNLEIKIDWWRHLVIEKFLSDDEQFIDNNLNIWGIQDWILHIITGPNMGWKSTFLRQNALIVLMAHCGLFVPAKNAEIWLVDGIFARVGSGDVIAKNQSTFMTEMIEVANILNNATKNSFVIFDELWRGTSTYDWLALTKAILEYIAVELECKTLIATHYHELIELEKYYSNIKNFSVSVYETDKEVIFMKKIVKWGADKSYWIDVAKLAGISNKILDQAMKNLEWFKWENKEIKITWSDNLFWTKDSSFWAVDPRVEKMKGILESIDINNITPLQAMQILEKLRGEL